MIRIALQTCLIVIALLVSASASLATTCANDPNECTPKKLCQAATNLMDGNTSWSTASSKAKHVTLALSFGMSCGVVAIVDPCDVDPNECKISQLCEKATKSNNGQTVWNSAAQGYVDVAKEYELTCSVKAKTAAVKKTCSTKTPEACKNPALCQAATYTDDNSRRWHSKAYRLSYVIEAKKRGLTCRVKAKTAAVTKTCSTVSPELCSTKSLCEKATFYSGGSKQWTKTSAHQVYVLEAKKRGLSCGVKAKTAAVTKACSTVSPELCSTKSLCEKATFYSGGSKQWTKTSAHQVYVLEAKKRGLNCGVKAKTAAVKKTCQSNPEACSEKGLCFRSTQGSSSSRTWATGSYFLAYVTEAKKRGLTCGVGERNASGQLPKCLSSGRLHNCFGTYTFPDGETYVGEWQDNKQNGQGTYTWPDGDKYVGEWKGHKINGQGTYSWPNGNKYIGEWKDGKRSGQGTFTYADGTVEKGIWKNNKLISQTANLFGRNDFNALNSTRRKQLQYGLKKLGYYTSTVDGKYGPNTQRAVRGYAKARGITSGYPNSVFNQIVSDFNVPAPSTNQASRKKSPSFFELLGAFAEGYNAVGQGYQGSNQSGSQSSNIGLRLKDSYRSGGNTMCRYNDGSVYNIGLGICPLTK